MARPFNHRSNLRIKSHIVVIMGCLSVIAGFICPDSNGRVLSSMHVWNDLQLMDSDPYQSTKPVETVPTEDPPNGRVTYDLGLGKNPSLIHGALLTKSSSPKSVREAAQYLMECDTVRIFPSPLILTDPNADTEYLLIPAPPVRYDLGLGRNPPASPGSTNYITPVSLEDATRYWEEYISVREYPSPVYLSDSHAVAEALLVPARTVVYDLGLQKHQPKTGEGSGKEESEQSDENATPASTKKKALTFLHPRRHTSDIFHIILGQDQIQDKNDAANTPSGSLPRLGWIAPSGRKVKVDPNTIWVELLLHSQLLQERMQLAAVEI